MVVFQEAGAEAGLAGPKGRLADALAPAADESRLQRPAFPNVALHEGVDACNKGQPGVV